VKTASGVMCGFSLLTVHPARSGIGLKFFFGTVGTEAVI
jgi:hypothetical protein